MAAGPTDLELLDAWRAGDGDAGRVLFERHFDGVFRFFRSKVDDAAEDLTQQTFEAVVAGRDRFRKEASFRTYLFTIARKKLYSHLRTMARRTGRELEGASMSVAQVTGPSPSTLAAARQEQRILFRALRRLPVDMQLTLELFYWEHMSVAEVAQVLEVPEGTVKSRLQRARARLETLIGEVAETAALRDSTIGGFDKWARELRERLGAREVGAGGKARERLDDGGGA